MRILLPTGAATEDIVKKAGIEAQKALKTIIPDFLDKETEKELAAYAQKKRKLLAKII